MEETASNLAAPSAETVRLYDSSTSFARGLKAEGLSSADWTIWRVCSQVLPFETSGSQDECGLCSFQGTNWLLKMPERARETPAWTISLLVSLWGV